MIQSRVCFQSCLIPELSLRFVANNIQISFENIRLLKVNLKTFLIPYFFFILELQFCFESFVLFGTFLSFKKFLLLIIHRFLRVFHQINAFEIERITLQALAESLLEKLVIILNRNFLPKCPGYSEKLFLWNGKP